MRRRLNEALHAAFVCCLLIAAAASSGCTYTSEQSWTFEAPIAETLRVDGPAIDVENFRGDVEVRIDPNARELRVLRMLHVHDDSTVGDRRTVLEQSPCDVTFDERDGAPVLIVRSHSALPDQDERRATLRIVAPSSGGVRVINGGGEVILVGVSGAIHVENERGPIEVRTEHALIDPVALNTGKGNIYLQAPFASTGAIDVDAGSGRAVFEAPHHAAKITQHRATRGRFTAVYNGGANPVLLRTGDGNASVMFIENPRGRVRTFR